MCSGELQVINLAALSDLDIGSREFQREVRRLTWIFGLDVHFEAQTLVEKRAAVILRECLYSAHVAQSIELQTRASVQAHRTSLPTAEKRNTQDNVADDSLANPLKQQDMSDVCNFFKGSQAYSAYAKGLLSFAHESYEARIRRCLCVGSRVIDYSGKALTPQGTTLAAQELSWTPTTLFSWSDDRFISAADRFKGHVEDTMGETWNWWPLEPRLRPLEDGFHRLSWQTVCLLYLALNGTSQTFTDFCKSHTRDIGILMSRVPAPKPHFKPLCKQPRPSSMFLDLLRFPRIQQRGLTERILQLHHHPRGLHRTTGKPALPPAARQSLHIQSGHPRLTLPRTPKELFKPHK